MDLSIFRINSTVLQDFSDSIYNNKLKYLDISNAYLEEENLKLLAISKLTNLRELKALSIRTSINSK